MQMANEMISLDAIQDAAVQLKGAVLRTPTIFSPWLSKETEAEVYLKLENLQLTGSFKPRGAYIKLISLSSDQRKKGIIAMSAGNHAQGVAYHAQSMGIPTTIVMPENTPLSKIEKTQKLGAQIILKGESLAESEAFALPLAKEKGLTVIHPYDDPAIMKGQGTVALEMLKDYPMLDTLLIPVGGGGLAAGMSIAARGLNPEIELIGVQSDFCPAMVCKLFPQHVSGPSKNPRLSSTLAEGINVKRPGDKTTPLLKEYLNDMILVTESQIEAAVDHLIFHQKLVVEGAGAAGVAAILQNSKKFQGKRVGIVLCGGNIDARTTSDVLLRSLVRSEKITTITVQVIDQPGSLSKIISIISQQQGNIIDLAHQRVFTELSAKMAEVSIALEVQDVEHTEKIMAALKEAGVGAKRPKLHEVFRSEF